jgi:large subunit ribosomal protein L9
MKVILQEEVKSVGQAGAVVDVSDGYARNFLLPRRKAVLATPANLKTVESDQRRLTAKTAEVQVQAEQLAQRLQEMAVTIPVQVGEGEKIFGSVTTKDIAAALAAAGVTIDKREIELEEPIKQTGEFTVTVRLHPSVSVPLRLSVVPEVLESTPPKKGRRKKTD